MFGTPPYEREWTQEDLDAFYEKRAQDEIDRRDELETGADRCPPRE